MVVNLRKIEKKRIKSLSLKIKKKYIIYPIIVAGEYIIIWYINREKEKGLVRFQFNKGLCISIKYKGYNTTFLIRSIIEGVVVEQQFFYYALNNIYILIKKHKVHYYRSNNLNFLRKKKNKRSKFIII